MKLLADENVDPIIIEWLRGQGHDVMNIEGALKGTRDPGIASMAWELGRVIVTNDADFGTLVFLYGVRVPGVIYMRLDDLGRWKTLAYLQRHWHQIEPAAVGGFITLDANKIRIRSLVY